MGANEGHREELAFEIRRSVTAILILDGLQPWNRRRSADWQSAVSPIGNRRTVYEHEAGCQPASGPSITRVELTTMVAPE